MSSSKKFTFVQSPLSSDGAGESTGGTPDTKITAFSPEDTRPSKSDIIHSTPLKTTHQDPFVSTGNKLKVEQKLSATATAFQPYALYGAMSTPMVANGSGSGPKPGTMQYLENVVATSNLAVADRSPSAESFHHGTFSTDTGASRCIEVHMTCNGDGKLFIEQFLEDLDKIGPPLCGSKLVEGAGSVASLRLSNINDATLAYKTIKLNHAGICKVQYIEPDEFARRLSPNSKVTVSRHEGQVILTAKYPVASSPRKKEFEEGLRDVLAVEGRLFAWARLPATEIGTFRMVAEFCDSTHAPRAIQRLDGKSIRNVMVAVDNWNPDIIAQLPSYHRLAHVNTPTRHSGEQSGVEDALGRMSVGNDQLPTYASFGTTGLISSNLPYVGHRNAQLPLHPSGLLMGGICQPSTMLAFQSSYAALTTPPRQFIGETDFTPPFAQLGYSQHENVYHPNQYQAAGAYNGSPSSFRYYGTPSPTGVRDILHGGRPSGRRQNAIKITHNNRNRQHSNALNHHNHVDVHRIRQGIDVRTTVMLRNIPNKVDQSMLKSIVDESSHGKYDFMYLRIDFSNDCNVGYAFINFTDPLDIIDFVIARSNQKWHRFKSDKVAEISYATIQGKDCLVQKFRNSSVMLEPLHYRPKLYFTAHDPFGRAGEEEEFPASDNASKLKRSCENAEHVGLFAPSAGQHLRDEQRRRRSQYDRGTSFAENEEFDFDEEDDADLDYPPFLPCTQDLLKVTRPMYGS